MAATLAYKLAVRDNLFKRLSPVSVEAVSTMANDANSFIDYCADYFPADRNNAEICAIGILAKVDSQKHPDRYRAFDMNSAFDARRCARRIQRGEDIIAIAQLEAEIIEALK